MRNSVDPPFPALSVVAVRRRFTAAAWASAVVWPLHVAVAAPLVSWISGVGLNELTADASGIVGLMPVVLIVAYLSVDAVRTVRAGQREVAAEAAALARAAVDGDRTEAMSSAYRFGLTLLMASTVFNTRVLPRRPARCFAEQVLSESKSRGLSPASLRTVQDLAAMGA
ncbi:hypothetical protein [Streptomyces sp. CAU 1734]|uniref:hypothetical protein n=1 Tax=Streptomyces sp. CAU 1734 TaxID=3140360 RepID=UPI003261746D